VIPCWPSFSTRFTASSFGPPFPASLTREESYDRSSRQRVSFSASVFSWLMLSMRVGHVNGYFYGRRPQAGCFATSISMTGGRSKGNAKSAQYRIVAVEHRTADAELPPMDQPIPKRLQPPAFRRRADRSEDHAAARQAHAAPVVRRLRPCAAQSAGLFRSRQRDRHRERPPAQEAL